MRRFLSFFIVFSLVFSLFIGPTTSIWADENNYAWVLVDRIDYPIEKTKFELPIINSAEMSGNAIEMRQYRPDANTSFGTGDLTPPSDLHAIYKWEDPPSVIFPDSTIEIPVEQIVITNNRAGYFISTTFGISADISEVDVYGARQIKKAAITYPDGSQGKSFGIGDRTDEQSKNSTKATASIKFDGRGFPSTVDKIGILIKGSNGGNVELAHAHVKYVYEWKEVSQASIPSIPPAPVTPVAPAPATTEGAEAFESGARLMWPKASNVLGYRLYRSKVQSQLGISVTDFYITSTSYADVNVEPNTTYYYSVKPVLGEANPYQGIEEKLGNVIATFVVTTGNEIYKPGLFKHFIMLKLDSPYMSKDGVEQEVDPGRGTTPIILAGRTMVPIRAIVEAMGGTVGWDGGTSLITLNARGNKVEMWLGKTDIKVNGVTKEMDIAPVAKDGRTYVPVRFAAENLNCKVDWINSTKEAVIVYEE